MDRVTMEDVAEEAGVSINTVSRALNDKPDINPQTKKEILQIAEELNYQPNRFAKGLRSSKTSTLGVIVADILNPFFSALLKGIEKSAREDGYSIIVQDTDEKYENEQSAIQTALAEQVDGLLISPVQTNDQTIMDLRNSDLPFVLLGRHFDDLETHYVVTDDVKGAKTAVNHLIEKGHERIALINGPSHISSSKERLRGYRQAMKNHGLSINESFILEDNVMIEHGYETAKNLLAKTPSPTAVLCYSDFVALGVIKAARDEGLKISDDLAVVGYDDIFFATCLEVPLTTVRIPKKKMGKKAFKTLKTLIGHEENVTELQKIKLETELVSRQST
ncbi:LacI family DNA-binding transcriptional regulator [Candidatus Bipolaricaulota bacterium]|nr:LacI family DNA-binding transcriptional regulator [Candidatus Bipolaricaulota bacterium]